MKNPCIWWTLFVLPAATLALASDLRLVEASQKDDKEAVRSLLKQHADVNASQPDGATALAWAAHWDDLETADLLIHAGADVNKVNDYGAGPLLLACANGSSTMVDKLLTAGANAKAAAWTGETALMRCSRTGSTKAVKSLISRGAQVNAKDSQQAHTALMWAAAQKHPDVIGELVKAGAEVDARSDGGFTPLLFAAQQGDVQSSRALLAAGANVNSATPDGDTPLLIATLSGYEALSIFLLDNGADPNVADRNGITALHYAILSGLARIANIPFRRFAPYLSRPNMVQLVKALLAHGANPNARLVSPLAFDEAGPGYGKILRIDVATGGKVSPVGATPFLLAAITFDAPLMRILVAGGANPTLATEENVTPLMVASGYTRERKIAPLSKEEEKRALEAVTQAVELGADVNATDTLVGLSALHAAAFCGSNTIVQFLVQRGAEIDAKDKAGQTPLHKALNIRPREGAIAANLLTYVIPYVARNSTAELLIKLGATPVTVAAAPKSGSN
jgi:ankyrin repeat protein